MLREAQGRHKRPFRGTPSLRAACPRLTTSPFRERAQVETAHALEGCLLICSSCASPGPERRLPKDLGQRQAIMLNEIMPTTSSLVDFPRSHIQQSLDSKSRLRRQRPCSVSGSRAPSQSSALSQANAETRQSGRLSRWSVPAQTAHLRNQERDRAAAAVRPGRRRPFRD